MNDFIMQDEFYMISGLLLSILACGVGFYLGRTERFDRQARANYNDMVRNMNAEDAERKVRDVIAHKRAMDMQKIREKFERECG